MRSGAHALSQRGLPGSWDKGIETFRRLRGIKRSNFQVVVGMTLIVGSLCVMGEVHATWVLLPVVWALQVFAVTGIVWFLSLLNVVLRDIQTFLAVLTMMLMIATPIAFTPESVPSGLRFILVLNPLAWFVIVYQKILVFGLWPTALELSALFGFSALAFGLGGYFFSCMKKAITDHV